MIPRRTFLGSLLALLGIGVVGPKALASDGTREAARIAAARPPRATFKFKWSEGIDLGVCTCAPERIPVYIRGRVAGMRQGDSNAWGCSVHGCDEVRQEDGVTLYYRRGEVIAWSSEDGSITITDPHLKAYL